MELVLVFVVVFAAWGFSIWKGQRTRRAWKQVAERLGLEYKTAFFLSNVRVLGQVEGCYVVIKYHVSRMSDWKHGKKSTRSKKFVTIHVSHSNIPKEANYEHPEQEEYRVANGKIIYPARFGYAAYDYTSIRAYSQMYSGNSDKLLQHIQFMIAWAKSF